ncbi:MAG: hypothetical protein V3T84_02305 [Phycisphaerales bacterium]
MKRWLAKLVVFLLLGVVVNVAVAWGLSVLLIGRAEPDMQYIERRDGSADLEPWGVIRACGIEGVYVGFHFEIEGWLGRWLHPKIDPQVRPRLDWSTLRSGSLEEARRLVDAGVFGEVGAGWPLKCLGYRVRVLEPDNVDSAIAYDWGLPVERGLSEPIDLLGRILPLRPIWLGFAINTVFYAMILSVPFAPFTLRRLIRRKRGLCINCGYDLRGAEHEACPECGVEV